MRTPGRSSSCWPRTAASTTCPRSPSVSRSSRPRTQNVADVEVVSAVELDEAQRERLAGALRARLRRDVRLHCTVDPALIGGAVVRSGDMLIDGSLAHKLERLGTELTTG